MSLFMYLLAGLKVADLSKFEEETGYFSAV